MRHCRWRQEMEDWPKEGEVGGGGGGGGGVVYISHDL